MFLRCKDTKKLIAEKKKPTGLINGATDEIISPCKCNMLLFILYLQMKVSSIIYYKVYILWYLKKKCKDTEKFIPVKNNRVED